MGLLNSCETSETSSARARATSVSRCTVRQPEQRSQAENQGEQQGQDDVELSLRRRQSARLVKDSERPGRQPPAQDELVVLDLRKRSLAALENNRAARGAHFQMKPLLERKRAQQHAGEHPRQRAR